MLANGFSRRRFLAVLGSAAVGAVAVACGQAPAPTPAPKVESKPADAKPAADAAAKPVIPPTPTTQPGIQDLPAPKAGQKVIKYWHNFGAGLNADVHTKQI